MNPVLFFDNQTDYIVSPSFSEKLESVILLILKEHDFEEYTVTVVLCDNTFIQGLNKLYRNKDSATDVLSFPTLENIEGESFDLLENTLGDIIISVDKVKRQAVEYQVSETEEFSRLLIHGVLHLIGYDHVTSPEDEKEMLDLQDHYLSLVFA